MSNVDNCNLEIKIPDPSISIFFFLIITGFYAFFEFQSEKISTKEPFDQIFDQIIKNKNNLINTLIYILILIVGNFFINIAISNSICGTPQWGSIFIITLFPWSLIFSSLISGLIKFPGWLAPFSNTIGYLICNFMGLKELMLKILKAENYNKIDGISEISKSEKLITENLNQIYSDPSILINQISEENFKNFWKRLSDGDLLNKEKIQEESNNQNFLKNQLYNFIVLKNNISKIIWFILTGLLITSIVFNLIVNNTCHRSLDKMEETHNRFIERQAEERIANENSNSHIYTN